MQELCSWTRIRQQSPLDSHFQKFTNCRCMQQWPGFSNLSPIFWSANASLWVLRHNNSRIYAIEFANHALIMMINDEGTQVARQGSVCEWKNHKFDVFSAPVTVCRSGNNILLQPCHRCSPRVAAHRIHHRLNTDRLCPHNHGCSISLSACFHLRQARRQRHSPAPHAWPAVGSDGFRSHSCRSSFKSS